MFITPLAAVSNLKMNQRKCGSFLHEGEKAMKQFQHMKKISKNSNICHPKPGHHT